MSKSDPDGCLFLTDEPDVVIKKIMKAKTDSISGITYDKINRLPLSNLIEIMALARNEVVDDIVEEFRLAGHQAFKVVLAETLSKMFSTFKEKYNSISDKLAEDKLIEGTKSAAEIASSNMKEFLEDVNK